MDEPNDTDDAFGRAVASRRAELGLSRKELAHRAGLSYSYVANIEAGHKHPAARTLRALAEALGVRPADLLDRADAIGLPEPSAVLAARATPPNEGRSSGAGWFQGGTEGLDRLRARTDAADLRDVVRQVVREELAGAPAPSGQAAAPPGDAGPPPAAAAPYAFPDWVSEPFSQPADRAIHQMLGDTLAALSNPTQQEVDEAIARALDDLLRRVAQRREQTPRPT